MDSPGCIDIQRKRNLKVIFRNSRKCCLPPFCQTKMGAQMGAQIGAKMGAQMGADIMIKLVVKFVTHNLICHS